MSSLDRNTILNKTQTLLKNKQGNPPVKDSNPDAYTLRASSNCRLSASASGPNGLGARPENWRSWVQFLHCRNSLLILQQCFSLYLCLILYFYLMLYCTVSWRSVICYILYSDVSKSWFVIELLIILITCPFLLYSTNAQYLTQRSFPFCRRATHHTILIV